jgi:plastocyanin
VLLAAMKTSNMIGLSVVALAFIAFALISSFVAPKKWPDFPGKNGLSVFVIASFVLFGAMLTAVEVFGVEEEAAHAGHAVAEGGGQVNSVIAVEEKEFRIILPALKQLPPANYTFLVKNVGKSPHDLVIEGGDLTEPAKTATIQPGAEAKLQVSLSKGTYTLYCSIDGHRQLGMLAKIGVG